MDEEQLVERCLRRLFEADDQSFLAYDHEACRKALLQKVQQTKPSHDIRAEHRPLLPVSNDVPAEDRVALEEGDDVITRILRSEPAGEKERTASFLKTLEPYLYAQAAGEIDVDLFVPNGILATVAGKEVGGRWRSLLFPERQAAHIQGFGAASKLVAEGVVAFADGFVSVDPIGQRELEETWTILAVADSDDLVGSKLEVFALRFASVHIGGSDPRALVTAGNLVEAWETALALDWRREGRLAGLILALYARMEELIDSLEGESVLKDVPDFVLDEFYGHRQDIIQPRKLYLSERLR